MGSFLAGSPPELSWFSLICARHAPNSGRAWRSRVKRFGGAQQFPSQMVHVKKEDRVREYAAELIAHPSFPAFRKKWFRIDALREKSVLVRYPQKVQHARDHFQMGNQHHLSQFLAEILVALIQARPKSGDRLAEQFGVDLVQMGCDLEAFVHLIGLQSAYGNAANQFCKRILAQIQVDIGDLHVKCKRIIAGRLAGGVGPYIRGCTNTVE